MYASEIQNAKQLKQIARISSFINSAQKLNKLPEKARQFAMQSVECIRLRDFFKIACYRSEWLCCRFLFLPAHSIYGFSKKLNIWTKQLKQEFRILSRIYKKQNQRKKRKNHSGNVDNRKRDAHKVHCFQK